MKHHPSIAHHYCNLLQSDFDRMKMVIGRRSNEHNSAILQAIEVKQTLLNFFFDSLSNDTKLYGFGWKNAKSAGLPSWVLVQQVILENRASLIIMLYLYWRALISSITTLLVKFGRSFSFRSTAISYTDFVSLVPPDKRCYVGRNERY